MTTNRNTETIEQMKSRHDKEMAAAVEERRHRLANGEPTYEDLVHELAKTKKALERASRPCARCGE